jgi:hypothetical protein
MDREDIIDSLITNDDPDALCEIINRMSSYLSDDQFRDCLRPVLISSCTSSEIAADLKCVVEGAIEDNPILWDEEEEPTNEAQVEWVVVNVRERLRCVLLLYDIDEKEYADRYLRDVAAAMSSLVTKYPTANPLLKMMSSDLVMYLDADDPEGWFTKDVSEYSAKVQLLSDPGARPERDPDAVYTPAQEKAYKFADVFWLFTDRSTIAVIEDLLVRRFEGAVPDGLLEAMIRSHILDEFNFPMEVDVTVDIALDFFEEEMDRKGLHDFDIDNLTTAQAATWERILTDHVRTGF